MSYSTSKIVSAIVRKTFCLCAVGCFFLYGFSQQSVSTDGSMVKRFYELNHQRLYWLSSGERMKKASDWLAAVESAEKIGLASDKVQIGKIRAVLSGNKLTDNVLIEKTDRQITGLVLNFIKVLQEGRVHFDYDEVSVGRDSVYIFQLLKSKPREAVSKIVSRLDCKDRDYLVLKKFLRDSITVKDTSRYNAIRLALNYRRFLSLNHQSEFIVVNILAAEASYYKNDLLQLKMRTVVGRKKNPTRVIASYITSIVTFPFWNVPYSIATKEIIPKVQKDERYLEQNNLEVIDDKGNVMEDWELNWSDYNENYFPYLLRQATGEDNSLGVLKFDLMNPFSIFLHSTGLKSAFEKSSRFLSHGCIRLQKPIELADALLRGKLDIEELKVGKKDTKSNTIRLPQKVPVFIIYMPVLIDGKKVTFLPDVYGLIK